MRLVMGMWTISVINFNKGVDLIKTDELVGLNQTFKMTLDVPRMKKDNDVVLNTTKVENEPNSKVESIMSIAKIS